MEPLEYLVLLSIFFFITTGVLLILVLKFLYKEIELKNKIKQDEAKIKDLSQTISAKDEKLKERNTLLENEKSVRASHTQQLIRERQRIKTLSAEHELHVSQKVAQARADALKKSRAVMRGQATEHLAPLMELKWSHKDFRFGGNPIDYVIYNGASAVTDGEADAIESVIFLEIKTGKSSLNKVQRRIRDAIIEGRIYFAIYNSDTNKLKIMESK